MSVLAPTINMPVIDRLTLVIPRSLIDDEEEWFANATAALELERQRGTIRPAWASTVNYKASFTLGREVGSSALVQLGPRRDGQRGAVRIECNPAKLQECDVQTIRRVVSSLFPGIRKPLNKALLNRVDIAVDVDGVSPNDLFISYKHAQKMTTVSKTLGHRRRRLETYNFGSFSSAYKALVYDKKAEQLDALLRTAASAVRAGRGISDAQVRGFQDVKWWRGRTRFEIRCGKLNGIPLSSFHALENRFERFRIWDARPLRPTHEPLRSLSTSTCRELGVPGFLDIMRNHELHGHFSRLFVDEVSWWDPADLWRQAVGSLARSGLFSPSAIQPPKRSDATE